MRHNSVLLAAIASVGLSAAVANAAVIDISNNGDTTTVNDAIWTCVSSGPAGSGVAGSILRIQNKDLEQGYNTNGGTPFDNKGGVSLNNGAVTLGDLTTIEVAGKFYVGVTMDWNEPNGGSKPALLLEQFQVYVSDSGSQTLTNFNGDNRTLPLGTLVYDLNSAGTMLEMADNFSGSGKSDYNVLIPKEVFDGFDQSKFFTCYLKISDTDGGFEEIFAASGDGPPPGSGGDTPEPASLGVLAIGAIGLLARRKR